MTDVFSEVRERVTAEEAARRYGMEFDRRGKNARCCFHSPDRNPSISFRNGRFRCWSCGAAGTSLDLTMGLFGLTVADAARRLNTDFALGLSFDREPTAAERQAARERLELIEAHKRFEAWRESFINRLNEVYRRGHLALQSGRELTGADAEAVRYMAQAEYYADTLSFGTPQDQARIYRERGQIGQWIDRALQN